MTSTAEDSTPRGRPQLALTDKPKRTRPRFDPSLEHEFGQKIAERSARGRPKEQQPQQESRDPSTEGVPSPADEEERRKRVLLPPPATPHPSRKFAVFHTRRSDSAAESATTPRDGGTTRSRPKESEPLPQRTMPRRVATPIGGPTQEQPLATPQRQPQSEQPGHSRQWEDRTARWEQPSGGRWEQRDYQDRSRSSRQWQDDQQWTEQSRYSHGRQDTRLDF